MEITRQLYWHISPFWKTVMYAGIFGALGYAAFRGWRRSAVWRKGRREPEPRTGDLGRRLQETFTAIFGHTKLRRDPYAGVMHLLIFYGFIGLTIATALVAVEEYGPWHFYTGTFYIIYSLCVNIVGLMFLTGLGMAVYRRYFMAVGRIENTPGMTALVWLLLVLGVGGFLLSGARIAIDYPDFARWRFVGYAIAAGIRLFTQDPGTLVSVYQAVYALHVVSVAWFFATLADSAGRHIVTSPANVFLRTHRPRGALRSLPGVDWDELLASPAHSDEEQASRDLPGASDQAPGYGT